MVTESSGFIGCHVVKELLDKSLSLVCIDNKNSYYDASLKLSRQKHIVEYQISQNIKLER